ncbi:MAG: hypothetical protein IPK79_11305 [Vampirovibrionales bacterium]|nr:hypothetical protein [Vampirovibrionales bacterium]
MWARSPSNRYAPFLMALLSNLGLFSTLMDALYADSHAKVRAWASYFNKYRFPTLMGRLMRQGAAQTPEQSSASSALDLVDRLLSMLEEPADARQSALRPEAERTPGKQDELDADCLPSHLSGFDAFEDAASSNPRARRERCPSFPRLRLIELLRRQRILLSNPAWGRPNYPGWWRDADIAPERLDDIARALQPRPTPTLLTSLTRCAQGASQPLAEPTLATGESSAPPLLPGKAAGGISERDRRLCQQLRLDFEINAPQRKTQDARHPP